MSFSYFSAPDLLIGSSQLLLNSPEQTARGLKFREYLGWSGVLENPSLCWQTSKSRAYNVFASCAETLWVLAGRSDITWLSNYLPRAREFSDDGVVWQAGYGERLLDWNRQGINQLQYCYRVLKEDPGSRQAVCNLWDVSRDLGRDLKDRPCTQNLQFFIRDGKLHLLVLMRSNDLIWGLTSINLIEFTHIQRIMAVLLGVEVGSYVHRSNSLHVYDRHYSKLNSIILESNNPPLGDLDLSPVKPNPPLFCWNWMDIRDICNRLTYNFTDSLYSEIPDCLDFLIDLHRVVRSWWNESPKESPLIEEISDPLLKFSVQNSWIPKHS